MTRSRDRSRRRTSDSRDRARDRSGRTEARPRLGVGQALRSVPRAAWVCALVALLNCAAWSLITPPFQVPDEAEHYAYVERVAQTGRPPSPDEPPSLSTSQSSALRALMTEAIKFHPENGSIWSAAAQRRLDADLRLYDDRGDGTGSSLSAGPQPPLYYALQAIPYSVSESGDVLDSLALMRLLSALLGAATVLFTFLFLREAIPGHPWSWTVGALGVAFQPLFGFVSGGVNSDALLFAAAAALFYCLARAFRRGLTTQLAVAIGAVVAVGFLGKLNFIGLLPGAAVGLLVLARRQQGALTWSALRLPGIALGVASVPILLGMLLNVAVWDRPAIGASSGVFKTSGVDGSISEALSYVWQFYVAPLPGMTHHLPLEFALRDYWVRGFVGRYGWIDTSFAPWVSNLGLALLALLTALVAAALARSRTTVRARLAEIVVYLLMAAGLMLLVGLASYNLYVQELGGALQMRYLLPLLALYGAGLALATRAAGPRWAPAIGTAIVMLALAHSLFSQLLAISRYYA